MSIKMWHRSAVILFVLSLTACASAPVTPPTWEPRAAEQEASEYVPYLKTGSGTISGQAFLTQNGGGVVVAAGQVVFLDPVTSTSIEWWKKAGSKYTFRDLPHPSPSFQNARKKTVADASGKFVFGNLPAGRYFVRTTLTWNVPYHGIQGGLLGEIVDVLDNQTANVILNHYAPDYPDQK